MDVRAVHSNESEDLWTQTERHQLVGTEAEKRMLQDWRQEIRIGDKVHRYCDKFLEMMEEPETMGYGQ